MTRDKVSAIGIASLTQLNRPVPDQARAERVRARCRAQLEKNRRHEERMTTLTGLAHLLVPMLAATFCALYLAALVVTVLRLQHDWL